MESSPHLGAEKAAEDDGAAKRPGDGISRRAAKKLVWDRVWEDFTHPKVARFLRYGQFYIWFMIVGI